MAMTNAERQGAWRARHKQRLSDLIEQASRQARQEGAARDKEALRNDGDEAKALEGRLLEAQRQINTLRSITRLDPRGVKEAIEPHLDRLDAQGRTKSATVSPATIHSCVRRIDQSLADWREIGDGEELAERLGAPLKPLRALRKRRAWGQAEIRQVADAADALRRAVDSWARERL